VSASLFTGGAGGVSFGGTFTYIDGNSEFSASDIGTIVFLSAVTPGGVTKTTPIGVGQLAQSVGYVVAFTAPNLVTVSFSPAFLDFTQINGILPVSKGGLGATTYPTSLINLIGGTPTLGVVLVWNGTAWVPSATPPIGGSISVVGQVAVGSGPGTITGSSRFTYTSSTGDLTLAAPSGSEKIILVPGTGPGFGATLLANQDGSFELNPQLSGTSQLFFASGGGLGINGATTAATQLGFGGASGGSAYIGVAAVAGSPNRMNLPTATGTPGQVLTTNGANPQQLSWTTVEVVAAAANLVAQTGNVASTASYAVPFSGAGIYEVSVYIVVSQPATVSSTLPDTQIVFTDQDSGAVISSQATSGSTGNTTSTFGRTVMVVNAAGSTNIQYNIGQVTPYTSSGATPMQYAFHTRVKFVG
jgi:hypothetical protein